MMGDGYQGIFDGIINDNFMLIGSYFNKDVINFFN